MVWSSDCLTFASVFTGDFKSPTQRSSMFLPSQISCLMQTGMLYATKHQKGGLCVCMSESVPVCTRACTSVSVQMYQLQNSITTQTHHFR